MCVCVGGGSHAIKPKVLIVDVKSAVNATDQGANDAPQSAETLDCGKLRCLTELHFYSLDYKSEHDKKLCCLLGLIEQDYHMSTFTELHILSSKGQFR